MGKDIESIDATANTSGPLFEGKFSIIFSVDLAPRL